MTVKEIFSLVLILLAGLILNRCAHLSGGQQVHRYDFKTPSLKLHVRPADSHVRSSRAQVETDIDTAIDEIGKAMEEVAEDIGESFEDTGEAFEERRYDREDILVRPSASRAPRTCFFLFGTTPPQEMVVEAPPADLTLSWDEVESRIRLEIVKSGGDNPVSVTSMKPGKATVVFLVPLEEVRLGMPITLSRLHLAEPFSITLQGGPDKLDIVTPRRDEVSLGRKGRRLTISGDKWEVTAEGIGGRVRVLGRKNRVIKSLAEGEETVTPDEDSSVRTEVTSE